MWTCVFNFDIYERHLHLAYYTNCVFSFRRSTGTPTEETWSGIQSNEDFLSYRFDHCSPQSLIHRAPRLDGDGLDLLNKFLSVRPRHTHALHIPFSFLFNWIEFIPTHILPYSPLLRSMKPKSGSQLKMQCAIRTFGRWDRWCTKFRTVNL